MAHFVYPTGWVSPLPAVWVPGPVEYELLWDQLFASVNGDAGGTWAPSGFVTFGGAGLRLAGTGHELQASSGRLTVQEGAEIRLADTASGFALPKIRVDGSSGAITLYVEAHASKLDVESGALLQVYNGGFLNISGAITLIGSGPGTFTAQSGTTTTFNAGSTVNFAGTANNVTGTLKIKSGGSLTVESGGTISCASGSTLTSAGSATLSGTNTLSGNTSVTGAASVEGAGTLTFADGKWQKLSPARPWEKRASKIALTTYTNATTIGPDDPDCWQATSTVSTAPVFRTRPSNNTGPTTLLEFEPLPAGGTMTTVSILADGTTTTAPSHPTYRIVRWKDAVNGFENMSSVTIDIHSLFFDWGSNRRTTEITVTAHSTIDSSYRYGLLVVHPWAGATSAMEIYDCYASGTSTEVQL